MKLFIMLSSKLDYRSMPENSKSTDCSFQYTISRNQGFQPERKALEAVDAVVLEVVKAVDALKNTQA